MKNCCPFTDPTRKYGDKQAGSLGKELSFAFTLNESLFFTFCNAVVSSLAAATKTKHKAVA